MIEFKTFNRIVNGNLRPFSNSFENKDGLDILNKEFFTFEIKVLEDSLKKVKLSPFVSLLKEGDSVKLEIDKETKRGNLVWPKSPEGELINLDIRPPIDEKSEIFTELIALEYLRIKKSLSLFLEEANNESELRFYVNKNYQYGIKLGKELHSVYKAIKCETSNFFSESNVLILENLKKHIIYSLLFIQDTFSSFIESELLTQYQLEDHLFEGEGTKLILSVNEMSKQFEKIYEKKLRKECEEPKIFSEVIKCYKSKLSDLNKKIQDEIEKNGWTPKYLINNKETIENILKEHLYLENKQKIESKLFYKNDNDKYKYLLKFVCDLKLSKIEDSELIIKSTLFKEINLQLDHLEKVIKLDFELQKRNIQKDLIDCLITLQARKLNLKSENSKNAYLTDLLRTKNYYVSDETRSGSSGSNQSTESGELDIAIRDGKRNGIILTIIEAFEINSIGIKDKIIGNHINKLIERYDSSGNFENYIIIYSNLKDIQEAWNKFKVHVETIVFNNKIIFNDLGYKMSGKHKLLSGYHNIPGGKMKIVYLFLDTQNSNNIG